MDHILLNQELLILAATHSTAPLKMARFAWTMQGLFSTSLLINNTTAETHHIHVKHPTWLDQHSTKSRVSHCPGTLPRLVNQKDNIWLKTCTYLFSWNKLTCNITIEVQHTHATHPTWFAQQSTKTCVLFHLENHPNIPTKMDALA